MFMDPPETLLMTAVGAFFLGWLVGKIGAYFGNKYGAKNRDPRDDRLRSLEAELRIAKAETEKWKGELEIRDGELREARDEIASAERHVEKSEEMIGTLRVDLKDSVLKTRELREELASRAEQNLKSEVKLREVETELSVAQASTDLLATGVLDYTVAPDADDDEDKPQVYKAAT